MRRFVTASLCPVVLIAFAILGCQGDPTSPATQAVKESAPLSGSSVQTHHCLGFYSLVVDTESLAVEALPSRVADWHFNLTGVLNATMGVSAAMIPGESDPANGLFVLDITLTHPFGTKPQLSGFDVKGVLITPGTLALGPLVFADVDETRLENADGYTRWWNPTEFTQPGMLGYTEGTLAVGPTGALRATVNPYKLFADILYADSSLAIVSDEPLDSPQGRAVFTAGSSNTRRYRIRFEMDPGPQVIYGYAIDCAWNPPDPNPPTEIPDDFPIEANQPEAFRIGLVPTVNTLFYDSESGVGGGVLRLQINVHDWQGQDAGDIPSEISAVRIFAPDLMTGGVDGVFLNETSTKARHTADLTGLAVPSEAGETLVICRIGSSDGSTYQQGAAPAPNVSLSAYQVISLDTPDPECTADGNNDFPEAVEIGFGESVIDQVCHADDSRDYYYFDIPLGFAASGEIRVYSAPGSIELGLYDESETGIVDVTSPSSVVTISLDSLSLLPGTYFLRVGAGCTTAVLPYFLELDAELLNVTPDSPVDVTPSTLFVNPYYVWLHDDYAYLCGYGCWVYDMSDPANPAQIAYENYYFPETANFYYPYCYYSTISAPDERQLSLIDFSDPLAPVRHEGLITYPDRIKAICVDSTHIYLATGSSPNYEIKIYEYATDPLNPTEVGSIPTTYYTYSMGLTNIEGFGKYLIAGDPDSSMIHAYSVEDPSAVTAVVPYPFPSGEPRKMTTTGNYIYLTYDKGGGDGWMYVMYLEPGLPGFYELGSVDLPGESLFTVLDWPYVYIGDGSAGLTVCDVSVPSTPVYECSIPLVSNGFSLSLSDDILCIIPYHAGMEVFDMHNPTLPDHLARLPVVNCPCEAEVAGQYLLVAENAFGFQAIKTVDISDPPNARVVGERFLSVQARHLDLEDDILAVASLSRWMLFDVSDPLNLSLVVAIPLLDNITAIAVHGEALYVALDSSKVEVYDISNLPSVSHTATLSPANKGYGFSFCGSYMYLETLHGLYHYSLADPLHPVPTGMYLASSPSLMESEVQGDYVYLVTQSSLEIADVSSPGSPSFESTIDVGAPDPLDGIAMDGQFAYLRGSKPMSPYVCSAWPPDTPSVLGPLHVDEHNVYDIVIDNCYLYEMCPYIGGVRIYRLY